MACRVASDERSAQPARYLPQGCATSSVCEITIREGDSFEVALKKFTRRVQQEGLLSEAKRRLHYEPPSVKRKRKAEARARKARKARLKAAARGY
jgi:small subunit ribosomal protein S21